MKHRRTGEAIDQNWQAPKGHPFTFDDVNGSRSTEFELERRARRALFYGAKQKGNRIE